MRLRFAFSDARIRRCSGCGAWVWDQRRCKTCGTPWEKPSKDTSAKGKP